jgi:hypothetical protein
MANEKLALLSASDERKNSSKTGGVKSAAPPVLLPG